jgi:hypothetical protein
MLVIGSFLPVLQYLWITLDGVDLWRQPLPLPCQGVL